MLDIKTMRPKDLARALDWAAEEGWNPGLDDAAAFYRADPEGFLMGWLGDEPVSSISVIRHNRDFAFLGLYICRAEYRGQGYGWQTWQAGMARADNCVIGLDGVVAQQANYAKSGFAFDHRTFRYEGVVPPARHPAARGSGAAATALEIDRAVTGMPRLPYLGAWFTDTDTRKTRLIRTKSGGRALGTIRACGDGHKVGPLYASEPDLARDLLADLADCAGATRVILDVPETNSAAVELAEALGMVRSFETARMYKGAAPQRDEKSVFGEVTLELG